MIRSMLLFKWLNIFWLSSAFFWRRKKNCFFLIDFCEVWLTRLSWRIFSISVCEPFVRSRSSRSSFSSSSAADRSAWLLISLYKQKKEKKIIFINSIRNFTWLSFARWSFFIVISISDSSFDIALRMIVESRILVSFFGSSGVGEIASVCGW